MNYGCARCSSPARIPGATIDLGNEPPLAVDSAPGALDRRSISLRWYSGTILNALSGAALMSGAVYVALDREATFAAVPERVEASRPAGAHERGASTVRKTDKLVTIAETQAAARQVMRIPTSTLVGEREVVRMRSFVRVAANLSLSTSELSAHIPAFNAARLLASAPSNGPIPADEAPSFDSAEMFFVMRDLAPALARSKVANVVPADEVMSRVREAASGTLGRQTASGLVQGPGGGGALAYAVEGPADPYAGLETRIVPENVTLLPKTAKETTGGSGYNERTVMATKRSDTVVSLLRELGVGIDDARAAAVALGPRGREGGLREGQKLRVLLTSAGPQGRLQPIRIIVMGESGPEAAVAFSEAGRYVSVDVQHAETTQVTEAEEDEEDSGAVRLYQSIYETALRQGIPRLLIDEMIRVYSYDVDFQRRVQAGDSFEILYPIEEEAPGGDNKPDLLYASLTLGADARRYYRFFTPDDSTTDYYDESGKSAKKFLVRKPVDSAIMRSGYGWRRHPVLGYSKMHTGVDWAAPRGTPILASGNGVVDKSGWEGGYGKYVRIRHSNGYETAYGHMTAFARGIGPGVRVRQGQLIGYVGSTGLSTGPHVHYEVMVNGRFVDPMRIKLPRGRSLEGALLASFERERDRVDAMMNRSPAQVAQTGGTRRQ